jgi:hypothetical protein
MPGLEIAELAKIVGPGWSKSGRMVTLSYLLMNRVCPNVRHGNITLWSSSWRLKFIPSQFPLPMALNSVLSDRDLKFVYLFCQTDTFLFVIETPIRKCKHPFVLVGTSTCKTWNIKTEIYY